MVDPTKNLTVEYPLERLASKDPRKALERI